MLQELRFAVRSLAQSRGFTAAAVLTLAIGIAATTVVYGIVDALLLKPGALDADERRKMQTHPRIGYELLQDSQNRFIQAGARIALHHHERYDGTGYPEGLAGTDIPIEARVVTTADVFDALISPRPYKPAWSIEEALAYLREQAGKLFDPACVDALVREEARLRQICAATATAARTPWLQ